MFQTEIKANFVPVEEMFWLLLPNNLSLMIVLFNDGQTDYGSDLESFLHPFSSQSSEAFIPNSGQTAIEIH